MGKIVVINGRQLDSEQNFKNLCETFVLIKNEEYGDNAYWLDKNVIKTIFSATKASEKSGILARLTLIDSMYSTQMNRRYYALEEIAQKLYDISQHSDLKTFFTDYAKNPNMTDDYGLFSANYGIGKNCTTKGVAISLISKYAYFETDYQFPIYDSIAREMIPLVWKYCGWGKSPKLSVHKIGTVKIDGGDTIKNFVNTINDTITRLGGNVSYDHLDRLLWFVGKIRRGNLSLLLSKADYIKCINAYNENAINKTGNAIFKRAASVSLKFFKVEKIFSNSLLSASKGAIVIKPENRRF